VRAGGALEAGQVASYCQSQPVSERLRRIAGRWSQFGEGHHALTLRRLPITVKVTNARLGGMSGKSVEFRSWFTYGGTDRPTWR
jgi:hypothetical protein